MESILNIFAKREHTNEHVYVREEEILKHNFKRYYIKYPSNRIEFWAHSERNEDESYFLGMMHGNEIILAKNFRTLPYDVQKGAGRVFRIYLHNDFREL